MALELASLTKDPQTALLVVDMQPDFYPGGALPVSKGDEIVERVADLMLRFQTLVMTQDSHPEGHISFASSYVDQEPFALLTLDDAQSGRVRSSVFEQEEIVAYLQKIPQKSQVLWPDHCVVGSPGWKLDSRLPLDKADVIVRKGGLKTVDSYSAFYENDGRSTGLGAMLRDRGVKRVVTVGLAGDYCVYWTAKDAIREGFQVIYDESLTRFVDFPEKSKELAMEDLSVRGAVLEALE